MKIKFIDQATNQPFANKAIQLQIKGLPDVGQDTLTLRTNPQGEVTLDAQYRGASISTHINGIQSEWMKAEDGATLKVQTQGAGKQADKWQQNPKGSANYAQQGKAQKRQGEKMK